MIGFSKLEINSHKNSKQMQKQNSPRNQNPKSQSMLWGSPGRTHICYVFPLGASSFQRFYQNIDGGAMVTRSFTNQTSLPLVCFQPFRQASQPASQPAPQQGIQPASSQPASQPASLPPSQHPYSQSASQLASSKPSSPAASEQPASQPVSQPAI